LKRLAVARIGVQDLIDGSDDHLGRSVDRLRYRAGRGGQLAGDLRRGQASQHLGVVLRPGQDVLVPDIEEGTAPDWSTLFTYGGTS
jgi:hypothetical protein